MSEKESRHFYDNLPVLDSFFETSDPQNYHPLPDDWHIGITDIVNSTHAINQDRYKQVNILGASPIVGILNKNERQMLPYTFGGDGCVICFPGDLLEDVRDVFTSSQRIGLSQYDMSLRAAIYPISYVRENGFDVKVSRFRVSDFYNQAVFTGGGLRFADEQLKGQKESRFHLSPAPDASQADFTGLECRWDEVSPPEKSVVTLLIQAHPKHDEPETVYNNVLSEMRNIFGFDEKTNPIHKSSLRMNMSFPKLMGEVKFRTDGQNWFQRVLYVCKMELQTLLGKFFMRFGSKTSETDWSLYKNDLTQNSDHRKFDDMLRLVISGTDEQIKKMQSFLEGLYQKSALAYGIHTTDSAVITCMVFAYHRQHIHFVDGSKGGYVHAAKDLKKRLETLDDKKP